MTAEQKSKIHEFRYCGIGYKAIASATGLKESAVKTYCSRNGLTDKSIAEAKAEDKNRCSNCGTHIE